MASDRPRSARATADVPAWVEWNYRLGLPAPVEYRPWVAQRILGQDPRWTRWRLVLTTIVVYALLWVLTGMAFDHWLVSWVLLAGFTSARHWRSPASEVAGRAMTWHGLRADGSVDPSPRPWSTIARHSHQLAINLAYLVLMAMLCVAAAWFIRTTR